MGGKKTAGIVLLAFGALILILSLALDRIGIGRTPGFGSVQIGGAIVGAIVTIVGARALFKK